jgi:lipopolysaccharide/colanic/teichoic acid biosynthesis glycosyltransferase
MYVILKYDWMSPHTPLVGFNNFTGPSNSRTSIRLLASVCMIMLNHSACPAPMSLHLPQHITPPPFFSFPAGSPFVYKYLKTFMDRSLALILLFLLSPLFIVVAILVYFHFGMPLLFLQKRPGYRAKPFMLLKFRTMTNTCDETGLLLPDAQRLTRFGRWLRATSIDELPGLVNIVSGDMSFIGPRPLLMQYLKYYSSVQARRHDVMPGLSGWAQINGRNSLSWDVKLSLDVWYVDHQTFWLDFRILLITIWKVFCRDGISAVGEATMSHFTGSFGEPR